MRALPCLAAVLALLGALPSPAPAAPRLSLKGARPTLTEDFRTAPNWRPGALDVSAPAAPFTDPNFSWAAGYLWNHGIVGLQERWPARGKRFPAWTANNNANADPNGDLIEQMGQQLAPLKWTGTLDLIADEMPQALASTIGPDIPQGYMGASIVSFPYSQRYGVFAMVAKVPTEQGVWPAFWLMPVAKTWPPELDIMEVIGKEPYSLHTTLHTKSPTGHVAAGHATRLQKKLSEDFHEYAVDWGPKQVHWYLDRELVFSQPTPESLHQPFYILVNIAVGKPDQWGGAPDATTRLPATMQVRSIRVWQRPEYQAAGAQLVPVQ